MPENAFPSIPGALYGLVDRPDCGAAHCWALVLNGLLWASAWARSSSPVVGDRRPPAIAFVLSLADVLRLSVHGRLRGSWSARRTSPVVVQRATRPSINRKIEGKPDLSEVGWRATGVDLVERGRGPRCCASLASPAGSTTSPCRTWQTATGESVAVRLPPVELATPRALRGQTCGKLDLDRQPADQLQAARSIAWRSSCCSIITGVGSLIHLYSVGYMGDRGSLGPTLASSAYLNLFIGAMLILVMGDEHLIDVHRLGGRRPLQLPPDRLRLRRPQANAACGSQGVHRQPDR